MNIFKRIKNLFEVEKCYIQLKKEYSDVKSRLLNLQNNWNALFEERNQKAWQITKLKEQNERLQKELAELKKKYEKVWQENRHLDKEVERLTRRF